jgi:YjbE family integral membrane protein
MSDLLTTEAITALVQVVMIDLTLAGDNVIVIGLAAAGLRREQRKKAILVGVVAGTALRILLAGVAIQLLKLVGLLLAGGLLLLWVCWKMWRELFTSVEEVRDDNDDGPQAPRKTLAQAARQIILADISMSLDNVLAVAGAAREHPIVLFFGLALSIALMGVAANFLARLLRGNRWLAYVGLAVILYVALEMMYRGALELRPVINVASGLSTNA